MECYYKVILIIRRFSGEDEWILYDFHVSNGDTDDDDEDNSEEMY